jgi:hypothetical protein
MVLPHYCDIATSLEACVRVQRKELAASCQQPHALAAYVRSRDPSVHEWKAVAREFDTHMPIDVHVVSTDTSQPLDRAPRMATMVMCWTLRLWKNVGQTVVSYKSVMTLALAS